MLAKSLMIAAPRSGSGKTVITLAILSALHKRNIKVRAAKSGPDYIDPAFHTAATHQQAFNLDSWAMPSSLLDTLLGHTLREGTLSIIEASMGLFDGIAGHSLQQGRGADIAIRYKLPVLLVLDVSGQAQSAAAIAYGFAHYDPTLHIAGIILNRVASPRHEKAVRSGLSSLNIPIIGCFSRASSFDLPERHLGLIQAEEHPALDQFLDQAAEKAEKEIDLDLLLKLASPAVFPEERTTDSETFLHILPPPGQRIALARDAAFSFLYPHILQGWRNAGADIYFFSPLANEGPPPDCDCCWLPGGYPELHAQHLSQAHHFMTELHKFSQTRRVHGECGGYMVLGKTLTDAKGHTYNMAHLLDHETSYYHRKMHLGYRQAKILSPLWNKQGVSIVRGHEFHYAQLVNPGTDKAFASLYDGMGKFLKAEGGQREHVTGCYFHAIALTSHLDREYADASME